MKKIKLLRAAAVAVLGLSLGAGVASAAPGDASITNTGPDSVNTVRFNNDRDVRIRNDNDLSLRNNTPQRAESGDATVRHNTTGGDATTGAASNDSLMRVNATIDNSSTAALSGGNGSGSATGTIDTTGPDSVNRITFNNSSDVNVNNDNDVNITNNNRQTAETGNARVSGNTTGGNATSGDASNISTLDVTLKITN
jgi:hypothetical protein